MGQTRNKNKDKQSQGRVPDWQPGDLTATSGLKYDKNMCNAELMAVQSIQMRSDTCE